MVERGDHLELETVHIMPHLSKILLQLTHLICLGMEIEHRGIEVKTPLTMKTTIDLARDGDSSVLEFSKDS